jgi:hypothetical protein
VDTKGAKIYKQVFHNFKMISALVLALSVASQVVFVNVTITAKISNPKATYCAGETIDYVVALNNPDGIPYYNSTGNGATEYSVEFRGAPTGPNANTGACGARGCIYEALGTSVLKDVVNAGSDCCGKKDASIQGHFKTLPTMIGIQGFLHPEVFYPENAGGSTNFMTSAASETFLIVDCSGSATNSPGAYGTATTSAVSTRTGGPLNSAATVGSGLSALILLALI